MRIASLVLGSVMSAAVAASAWAAETEPSAGAPPVAEQGAGAETAAAEGEPIAEASPPAETAMQAGTAEETDAAAPADEESVEDATAEAGEESLETAAAAPATETEATAPSDPPPPAAEPALGPLGYDAEGQPGRIHIVRTGDTLWDISEAYLGTPWVWPSIWGDNPDVANPHRIYPGDRIWITPTEMRRVSAEEAEQLLAGQPMPGALELEPMPAAIEETTPIQQAAARTFRWSAMEGASLVSSEELDAAASIIDSPYPTMWYAQGNDVYVGLGEGEVRVGDQFTVVRAIKPVHDLARGMPIGVYVEKLGWIEITEVHAESSLAEIRISTVEMARGDRILPRQVPSDEIPVLATSRDIEGRVVYTPDSRIHMGEEDIVFLDRGADHGLQTGNELVVYRRGELRYDSVRQAQLELPDRVFAHLLVLSVQNETAVALVTDSQHEISRGDRFRGSAGATAQ